MTHQRNIFQLIYITVSRVITWYTNINILTSRIFQHHFSLPKIILHQLPLLLIMSLTSPSLSPHLAAINHFSSLPATNWRKKKRRKKKGSKLEPAAKFRLEKYVQSMFWPPCIMTCQRISCKPIFVRARLDEGAINNQYEDKYTGRVTNESSRAN